MGLGLDAPAARPRVTRDVGGEEGTRRYSQDAASPNRAREAHARGQAGLLSRATGAGKRHAVRNLTGPPYPKAPGFTHTPSRRPNTLIASWNETPCLLRFAASFLGSHWKLAAISSTAG